MRISRFLLNTDNYRITVRQIKYITIRLVVIGLILLVSAYVLNTWLYSLEVPESEGGSLHEEFTPELLLSQIEVSPEAAALPKKGEILCWLLTSEKYHDTRARAINETWLSRCDHGVFFTNSPFKKNANMPYRTVFAGIPDKYANLFHKSRFALYYISEIMQADFEWFFKADDDTYIIMENLRAYLRTLDPTQPYYVGYLMKPHLDKGYNSGGGGYVLSRKALELFARHAYNNSGICPYDDSEDVGIGRCLANLRIFPHATINSKGQQRFNGYHPYETFDGWTNSEDWILDPQITGIEGIPRDLISFHHLSPNELRLFDTLLYRVSVNGDSIYDTFRKQKTIRRKHKQ